jgi:chromosome partitioning protein
MIHEMPSRARVIVVANEKGGSGKSTIAMHIAIALLKAGENVATIDLDSRQKSFTHYIDNRRAWAAQVGRDLGIPEHFCLEGALDVPNTESRAENCRTLTEAVGSLSESCNYLVIDTPGHDSYLVRLAHAIADTLITPLNDSFVDFDVLGTVDPASFGVTGTSHYAQLVEDARSQRQLLDNVAVDWIVLRNRLSTFGSSRNKRFVGDALAELSRKLNFRFVDGLAERTIFREFYPRGLTAVDDLDELTLGTRPTMSHATARLEVENLLAAIGLSGAAANSGLLDQNRDAA